RAQGAVDEAAHQDRLGRGATLTTEERAGNLARGVRTLFDVDRQRKKVKVVFRLLRGAGGRQQHGVFIEVRGDRALCLLSETSGFKAHGALAKLAIIENGFGELNF